MIRNTEKLDLETDEQFVVTIRGDLCPIAFNELHATPKDVLRTNLGSYRDTLTPTAQANDQKAWEIMQLYSVQYTINVTPIQLQGFDSTW